ncbi:MAG: hypothetical protein ACK56F_10180, partial [bacterium]
MISRTRIASDRARGAGRLGGRGGARISGPSCARRAGLRGFQARFHRTSLQIRRQRGNSCDA